MADKTATLRVEDLSVAVEGKEILKGLSLEVPAGEVHAIMGPNGSGKSTLANTLMGHPRYKVTDGRVLLQGRGHHRPASGRARPEGPLPGDAVPDGHPRRDHGQLPARRHEDRRRDATCPCASSAPRSWTPWRCSRWTSQLRPPLRQRRLLRRREEARRSAADEPAASRRWPSWTRPTPASTSTRCAPSPRASTPCDRPRTTQKMGILLITHYQRLLNYIKPDMVHVLYRGRMVRSRRQRAGSRARSQGLRLDYQRNRRGTCRRGRIG